VVFDQQQFARLVDHHHSLQSDASLQAKGPWSHGFPTCPTTAAGTFLALPVDYGWESRAIGGVGHTTKKSEVVVGVGGVWLLHTHTAHTRRLAY
jgi:hypothetical protein